MKMNFRFALPLIFSLTASFSLSANAQSQGGDQAAIIACIESVKAQAEELRKQAGVVCADEATATECLAIREQLMALREKFRACVPNAGALPKAPNLPNGGSVPTMPQLPNGGSVPTMPQLPNGGSVPTMPQLPDGVSVPTL